jgi:hypothetical protein
MDAGHPLVGALPPGSEYSARLWWETPRQPANAPGWSDPAQDWCAVLELPEALCSCKPQRVASATIISGSSGGQL